MIQAAKLTNGIQVLLEDVPFVRSVAIGVWVDIGSRDESDNLAGVSHFIEHLMFKGTTKRSAKDIAEALDAVGGQLNAFTTKEYTCYYARVLDEHLLLGIDLLGDMLLNSRFDQTDINRERNVILEEIKMYEDTPDELVHDVFASAIWQSHSLGRPISGCEETVQSLSEEQLTSFFRQYYTPGNIIISASGSFNKDKVLDALNNVFGQLSGAKKERHYTLPVPKRQVGCRIKDNEQVHICLGSQGLALDDENIYVMQIINTILGGGLSSRLFQNIREERGLVYSIYSYHSSYHDTGLFCIYTGLSKHNVRPALELIIDELYNIQSNGVGSDELQRAKDQLKGSLLLSLESVSTRMSRLGKSQLYLDKIVLPDEVLSRVMRVSETDIKNLAQEILMPDKFCLASVGPWENTNILNEIVK